LKAIMTTLPSIIYAIIHGITAFWPVSDSAHQALVPYLFGGPETSGAFMAALSIGAALSLFVYFRHDWASIISGILTVVAYRRKPMTIDERMPVFMFFTGIPLGLAWLYLRPLLDGFEWSPLAIAGALAGGALLLWFADSRGRKTKRMFDWNWLDCLIVGIFGIIFIIPGAGIPLGMMSGALIRNYTREAAVKYCFFSLFPILVFSAYYHFHNDVQHGVGMPAPDLSWLSFGMATVVTFLTGLLAIGALTKHVLRKGFGQHIGYRLLLAGATVAVVWVRSRS
jgi:undecaprenyl-diphosphatase